MLLETVRPAREENMGWAMGNIGTVEVLDIELDIREFERRAI
jgi:hypothetical protein